MALLTVPEAAQRLGVSTDTVKRRLKKGELQGHQEPRPQGYTWLVDFPDEPNTPPHNGAGLGESVPTAAEVRRLEEIVSILQQQLDERHHELERRGQEIERFQILLQQALDPARTLAAPLQPHGQAPLHVPWWRRLWQRAGGTG